MFRVVQKHYRIKKLVACWKEKWLLTKWKTVFLLFLIERREKNWRNKSSLNSVLTGNYINGSDFTNLCNIRKTKCFIFQIRTMHLKLHITHDSLAVEITFGESFKPAWLVKWLECLIKGLMRVFVRFFFIIKFKS